MQKVTFLIILFFIAGMLFCLASILLTCGPYFLPHHLTGTGETYGLFFDYIFDVFGRFD